MAIAKEFDLPIDSMEHLPERKGVHQTYCPKEMKWKAYPMEIFRPHVLPILKSVPSASTCTADQHRNTTFFLATSVTEQKLAETLVIGCMPCMLADLTVSIRHLLNHGVNALFKDQAAVKKFCVL